MKNFISYFLFSVSLIAVSSCSDDATEGIVDNSINNTESVLEQAKNRILSMGLDTTDMIEIDGYYVVENDILINKDSLFNVPQTRQYSATFFVSNLQTITIGVDNTISMSSGWIEAIKSVVDIYNEYTGLKFVYSEYNPTIRVSKKDFGDYRDLVCAQGEFPTSSRRPGSNVYINTRFFADIDNYLSHNEKVFLLMHEVGHNLGLRHTDCAVNGEGANDVGMVKIPNTPDTDSNSYMNSGTCGYSWTGMPEYDAVALKYLWTKYYTIHFANCNISDVSYKGDEYYVLDRMIIPSTPSGYVFAGWYYDAELTEPYYYTRLLNQNITLYPKWVIRGNEVTVYSSTVGHNTPVTFSTDKMITVTMTGKVFRGLYEWSDFTNKDYYCSMLARTDNGFSFYYRMPFRDYSLDVYPYAYVMCTKNIVLEPGRYNIISQYPKPLEEQEGASGMHGSTATIVTYYQ